MPSEGNFELRPNEVWTSPSVHSLLPEMMMVREPLSARLGPPSPIKRRRGLGAEKGTVHSKRRPLRRRCSEAVVRKARRICWCQSCRCLAWYSMRR